MPPNGIIIVLVTFIIILVLFIILIAILSWKKDNSAVSSGNNNSSSNPPSQDQNCPGTIVGGTGGTTIVVPGGNPNNIDNVINAIRGRSRNLGEEEPSDITDITDIGPGTNGPSLWDQYILSKEPLLKEDEVKNKKTIVENPNTAFSIGSSIRFKNSTGEFIGIDLNEDSDNGPVSAIGNANYKYGRYEQYMANPNGTKNSQDISLSVIKTNNNDDTTNFIICDENGFIDGRNPNNMKLKSNYSYPDTQIKSGDKITLYSSALKKYIGICDNKTTRGGYYLQILDYGESSVWKIETMDRNDSGLVTTGQSVRLVSDLTTDYIQLFLSFDNKFVVAEDRWSVLYTTASS